MLKPSPAITAQRECSESAPTLDEPFGALDAQVRKELRRWLRRLHEELHITALFVTRDQDEALEFASTSRNSAYSQVSPCA